MLSVLDGLGRLGREPEGVYARRAFCKVVHTTLRYTEGSVVDAERWLAFAQNLGEGSSFLPLDVATTDDRLIDSQFGNAVIIAVKSAIAESPRFVRYQNEIASSLAGVVASSANTRGLALLRSLLATAPPLDAPIIFLPQQRTMFLIQRIQTWIISDCDLGAEVQASLAELFLHLAPIVQELSGSHWDLFFDIIEFNLEVSLLHSFLDYSS